MLTGFEASVPHDTLYAMLWLTNNAGPDSRRSGAYDESLVSNTPDPGSEVLQTVPSNDWNVPALGLNGAATDVTSSPFYIGCRPNSEHLSLNRCNT